MDEKALKSIPLFASLSRSERRQVASWTDEVDVTEGKALVKEGEFAYEVFIIEEGTAEVVRDGKRVAELGPGDFLGEMGAIRKARRNASVVAKSPMRVVVMTARDFRRLEHEMSAVAQQIRDAIAARSEVLAG
ncbi:MAG TPA: cyclic nucleotide-binding domain-containing protein [Thermoleophilaceae bacterium]|nr:cyclic nucleotide-binding domain-containing protein [Thermoleophilaceae bacterium]